MNAYQLADFLDYELIDIFPNQEETINMLRKQANQIKELEQKIKWLQAKNMFTNKEINQFGIVGSPPYGSF